MKKLNIFILLALLTLTINSNASTKPAMNRAEDERPVSNFKGIAAGGSLDVKITIGNTESLRLEGDKDAIADITTEVIDGILTIKHKTKWNDWARKYGRTKITVYITAKKISSLVMSGSGNMNVENTINSSELSATLSGSGSLTATANVKSLVSTISGSGNVNLSGKTDKLNITISGSGNFRGKDLAANQAAVQVSGSADVKVNVINTLEAVISGSGSVSYTGNPTVKKTIIGSGSVSRN